MSMLGINDLSIFTIIGLSDVSSTICQANNSCLSLSATAHTDELDTFAFFHEGALGCLGVRDHMLYLSSSCKSDAQLWKWVTRGRLFNIGSSLCLGITVGNVSTFGNKSPLGVFRCDYEPPRVRWTWSCSKFLETLETYLPSPKLLLNSGNVSVADSPPARSPSQKFLWRVYDDQDLCAKSYRGKHIKCCCFFSLFLTVTLFPPNP